LLISNGIFNVAAASLDPRADNCNMTSPTRRQRLLFESIMVKLVSAA
jgi:hypothetical protein